MADRKTAVITYDHTELLDVACITTPLYLANLIGRLSDPYQVQVVSLHGAPIRCDTGLTLQAHGAVEHLLGPPDTLIVAGGVGHLRAADSEPLLRHVRRLADASRRVASVCTGATILAAAGLLDGKRATTHWRFAADLVRKFPRVTVDPDPIFIRDGSVATAAGVTSALDLTLAFIEEDHGVGLASQVSRDLVTYLHDFSMRTWAIRRHVSCVGSATTPPRDFSTPVPYPFPKSHAAAASGPWKPSARVS